MNIIFFILLNNNLNPLANTRSLTDLKKKMILKIKQALILNKDYEYSTTDGQSVIISISNDNVTIDGGYLESVDLQIENISNNNITIDGANHSINIAGHVLEIIMNGNNIVLKNILIQGKSQQYFYHLKW